MSDTIDMERAMAYVDDMVWRLETLQHRAVYNVQTGKVKTLPTRLRRFSNGIPQDNVAMVLSVLESSAPYSGVVFNGEDNPDDLYRPTVTMIKKDQTLTTGADATYTVIQDLLLASEADTLVAGEASSCSQETTAEYHWDEASVIDCPQGEQGVTWQVVGISRSAETDLFSYSLRKTVAITQHAGPATSVVTRFGTVTIETWDNVYGEPGDYKWDSYRHDGSSIEISASLGTRALVDVSFQENPDCTFKVTRKVVTSRRSEWAEFMRVRDQYQKQTMDLTRNEASPLSKAGVEYSNGLVTKYETKENDDGTYDNRVSTTEERRVPESTVSRRLTPYGAVYERTDTNMPTPATGLPSGYQYGSYEFTKTPGGLYVNKYMGVERTLNDIGVSCKQTQYQHDHSFDATLATMPSVRSMHVPAASGGLVTEVHVRVNESGQIVETKAEGQELEVQQSTVETVVTPKFTSTRRTDTNMPYPASGIPVGSFGSYKYTKTPGKLYVNEYSYVAVNLADFGRSRTRNAFSEDHVDDDTVRSFSDVPEHVDDAARGKVVRVQARQDDSGAIVRTTETTWERYVKGAAASVRKTPRAIILTITDRNVQDAPSSAITSGYGSGLAPGYTERRETNPGRTTNIERTQVIPIPGAVSSEACAMTISDHTHVKDVVLAEGETCRPEVLTAAGGVYGSQRATTTDDGLKVRESTVTRELNHEFGSRVHEDALQSYQVIENSSARTNIGDPSAIVPGFTATEDLSDHGAATRISRPSSFGTSTITSVVGTSSTERAEANLRESITMGRVASAAGFERGIQVIRDSDLTKGGLFHTKDYKYIAKPQKWRDHILTSYYVMSKWTFRNLTQEQIEPLVKDIANEFTKYCVENASGHPDINRTLNEFGLYDGTVSFVLQLSPTAKGSTFSGRVGDDKDENKEVSNAVEATKLVDWWEKQETIAPVTSRDPLTAMLGKRPWFERRIVWTHYEKGWGRGIDKYKTFVTKVNNGALWHGSNISYNRTSQEFDYVIVTDTRLRVFVQPATHVITDNAVEPYEILNTAPVDKNKDPKPN